MSRSKHLVFAASLGMTLGVVSTGHAHLTTVTVNKCLAGKLKALGTSVAASTKCHASHAAKPDAAKLVPCLAKASARTIQAYAQIDRKYPALCPAPNGDGDARQQDADAFAIEMTGEIGTAAGVCDAAKQRCVGKYVAAILGCYAKAATKDGVVGNGPGSCTAKAMARLADGANGCLDKAAANGDCTHAGSQALDLRGASDAVADGQTCLLDPAAGGCGAAACPTAVEFAADVDDPRSNYDMGWNWLSRNKPFGSGALLTMAITGASGNACTFAGPIPNVDANAGALDNQRCTDDTSIRCSNAPGGTSGPCAGFGTCEFFWSPPLPVYFGVVGFCLQDRVVGAVSGTVDPTTGDVLRTLTTERKTFHPVQSGAPCPRCVGDAMPNDGLTDGTCSGGLRAGSPCDANAAIAVFPDSGATSLDCPNAVANLRTTATQTMIGSTGATSITLSTASPPCTTPGHTDKRCACDTCNNAAREVCTSNADCPASGGLPGICGGPSCKSGPDVGLPCRTCLGGGNDGRPCFGDSECPSGTCLRPTCAGGAVCGRAGEQTVPNTCFDDSNTPTIDESLCVDTAPFGDHEGTCQVGPIRTMCRPSSGHPQRQCFSDSDCCDDLGVCATDPVTPGDCSVFETASCYLDNGIVGNSVTSEGAPDPLGGLSIATPKIGSLYCSAPTTNAAFNSLEGRPGVARIELIETMRFR